MGKVALGGAVDLHCHFGPESVIGTPHSVDASGAAADAAGLGFAALAREGDLRTMVCDNPARLLQLTT